MAAFSKKMLALVALLAGGSVQAQGISNARDVHGDLIERGAVTRSYQAVPMVNSATAHASPQGYAIAAHRRTSIIRARK